MQHVTHKDIITKIFLKNTHTCIHTTKRK